MKNLILTMAVIIFALPICSYTLELNKVLQDKKAVFEVCKISTIDAESSGSDLDVRGLSEIVSDNLKEQFPKGGYAFQVLDYKNNRDFKIRIFGKRGSMSFSSTSLLDEKGGQ